MIKAKILGIGSYVPEKILTNFDLEKIVDTSDEWITTRSGIKERHIIDENTASSDLATEASKKAIAMAGIDPKEIELIIVGTVTPDHMFPNTATIVQTNLGLSHIPCFDLEAACTGFIYGLTVARAFIESQMYKKILVIGVECLTRITNWEDRGTCVLFGDGAGAAIVGATDENDESQIMSTFLNAEGSLGHLLIQPAGGSRNPATAETVANNDHTIYMAGREVFMHAIKSMNSASKKAIELAGITSDDLNWVIPHQANIRIIEGLAKKLKKPLDKVIVNIEKYGNTSAASIPIAICEAIEDGRIKRGDKLLLVAFGGGFTWGATVISW